LGGETLYPRFIGFGYRSRLGFDKANFSEYRVNRTRGAFREFAVNGENIVAWIYCH